MPDSNRCPSLVSVSLHSVFCSNFSIVGLSAELLSSDMSEEYIVVLPACLQRDINAQCVHRTLSIEV